MTLGKTPENGNGRFIRFGAEQKAFFSGIHVWLDTDAKGWANAQIVPLKPEEVATIEIPFAGAQPVVISRAKKDSAWAAAKAPAGQKLSAEKAASVLSSADDAPILRHDGPEGRRRRPRPAVHEDLQAHHL